MNASELANRARAALAGVVGLDDFSPLAKATYIELFFDLVFIFCMRSIIPLITDVEGGSVGWYTYYTFWFTFVLMLQVWFNSTVFMSRFGTGGISDIAYLFGNMFLLSIMVRAISTGWEHYVVYNVCWMVLTIGTMVHWFVRYLSLPNPSLQTTKDTRMVMAVLGAQVALVAVSHALPKNPAQVVCLIALLVGFLFWYAGGRDDLGEASREHLAERCALLMILTFGETLIGFGNEITTDLHLFPLVSYFLLIVGMFLVYLNEIVNLLDLDALGGGKRYMALSAWLTFCVANVTAGFEMEAKSISILGMEGSMFFGASVAVFLLSFFMFAPFNRHGRLSAGWIVARVLACFAVLAQSQVVAAGAVRALSGVAGITLQAGAAFVDQLWHVTIGVVVAAVFAVLAIDRIVVRRERRQRRS